MTPSVPSLPTKSWVRLGPVAARGPLPFGVHDAAVGQHHLEPDDHVLDLPVAGRVLARPAAGQPAADGREVHRLGPVAERVAVADAAQRVLEIGAEGAGPHVGGERHLVDVDEALQRGQVERDAAVHRDGAAADAAASGRGGHRHEGLVAGGEHGRDLLGRVRAHHDAGALGHGALGGPADGEWPPVPAGLGPGGVVGEHLGAAGGQAVEQAVGKRDGSAGEAIGDGARFGVDRRDRRRSAHRGRARRSAAPFGRRR